MEVTKKRNGVKQGITRLRNGKWRLMVVWIALHGDIDDDIEIVEGHLLKLHLQVGVIFKEVHELSKTLQLLAPFKGNVDIDLRCKLRFVITGNGSRDDLQEEITRVHSAIHAEDLSVGVPLMGYVKHWTKDNESMNQLKKEFLSRNPDAFLNFDKNVLLGFCEGAVLLVVGTSLDASLDVFFWRMGVTVVRRTNISEALKFVGPYKDLTANSNMFRVLIHTSDSYMQSVKLLRQTWGDTVPILVYGEGKLEEIDTAIYDFRRVKSSCNQPEALEFGFMRPLAWAPFISRSVADLLINENGERKHATPEDGILTIRNISCWDLYPKDSNGLSDPYVEFLIESKVKEKFKTPCIKKTRCPEWLNINWTISCHVSEEFKVYIWDWDLAGGDDFEGLCLFDLKTILEEMPLKNPTLEKTFAIKPKSYIKKIPKTPGLLKIHKIKARDKSPNKSQTPRDVPLSGKKPSQKYPKSPDSKAPAKNIFTKKIEADTIKIKSILSPRTDIPVIEQVGTPTLQEGLLSARKTKQSNIREIKKVPYSERKAADAISGTITFELSWTLDEQIAGTIQAKKHFGRPIKQSLQTAKDDGQEHIAIKICKYLSTKGTQQQGIFRIPGVAATVHAMKDIIDTGEHISLQKYRLLDVAGLLKLYFRELPDALLPSDMFHYILNYNLQAKTDDEIWVNVEIIQRIINMLDVELRVVWKSLVWCLMDIAENSGENKMNSSNLSTCLAPTVMISQKIANGDPQKFLEASKYAVAVMQCMIDWGYDCFDFDKKEKIWADESDEEKDKDKKD